MIAAKTWLKVGQVLSSVCLGLTGSWLLVIGVGGILTLGALSLFHLGVLLSLGCLGVCLLVAAAGWLTDALSLDTAQKRPLPILLAEDTRGWSLEEVDEESLKQPTRPSIQPRFNRLRNRVNPDEAEPRLRQSSDPLLNKRKH